MLSLPPIRLGERTVCLPLSPLGSIELANLWLQAGAGEWRSGWKRLLVLEPALALWAVLAQPPSASAAARQASASAQIAPLLTPAILSPVQTVGPTAEIKAAEIKAAGNKAAEIKAAENKAAGNKAAGDGAAEKTPRADDDRKYVDHSRNAHETVEPHQASLDLDTLAAICQQSLLPAFQTVGSHDPAGMDSFDPSAWADGLWALRAARRALRAERAGLTGESWTAEWLGDASEWVARAQAIATETAMSETAMSGTAMSGATEATGEESGRNASVLTGERSAGASSAGSPRLPHDSDRWIIGAAPDRLDRLAIVRRKRRLGPLPELPAETKLAILARWSAAMAVVDLLALARRLDDAARQAQRFRQELAQEKLMALRDLAYGASHEINNPLANIATRAQGLIRDELDPERRRSLAVIASQALRAHTMIADMMLFAKPPALRCARVELDDLPPRIIEELSARAAEQGSTLAIAAAGNHAEGIADQAAGGTAATAEPAPMSASVWADRDQLLVALRALVENALEALGRGGRVEIAVWTSPDCMCGFRVTDTGPGVPAEARSRLFDPYYSGREAGRGLGLGLCKAWRIATDHGGRLSLDEQFSPGARFVLELPRHA